MFTFFKIFFNFLLAYNMLLAPGGQVSESPALHTSQHNEWNFEEKQNICIVRQSLSTRYLLITKGNNSELSSETRQTPVQLSKESCWWRNLANSGIKRHPTLPDVTHWEGYSSSSVILFPTTQNLNWIMRKKIQTNPNRRHSTRYLARLRKGSRFKNTKGLWHLHEVSDPDLDPGPERDISETVDEIWTRSVNELITWYHYWLPDFNRFAAVLCDVNSKEAWQVVYREFLQLFYKSKIISRWRIKEINEKLFIC